MSPLQKSCLHRIGVVSVDYRLGCLEGLLISADRAVFLLVMEPFMLQEGYLGRFGLGIGTLVINRSAKQAYCGKD